MVVYLKNYGLSINKITYYELGNHLISNFSYLKIVNYGAWVYILKKKSKAYNILLVWNIY